MQSLKLAKPQLKLLPTLAEVEPPAAKEWTLRPYQEEIKKAIYKHYREGVKSVLLVGTGGLGKTLVAAWIMRDRSIRAKNPARSIFLVEKNCLLEQTSNALKALGVDCSIIQGSRKVKWDHPCMVASLQTLRSWHDQDPKLLKALDMAIVLAGVLGDSSLTPMTIKMLAAIPNVEAIKENHNSGEHLHKLLGKLGMLVLDEAHDGVGQKIYQVLYDSYYPDDKCVFLGLTGSPWRMNREEWLGRWYEAKVESLQPPEAIKAGWLAPCQTFSLKGLIDISTIGSQGDGDYSVAAMGKQSMRPKGLQSVVDNWLRLTNGRPTLCFCSTVAQAKAQAECFTANGIAADYQHGGTPKGIRNNHDEGLSAGTLQVVCSVNTQTKGYDRPCIEVIIMARATKSKSAFFQAAWRGCRPFPGKERFYLLDFGGNLDDGKGGGHGDPMSFHDYDISEPRAKKRSDEPVNMIKDCPSCGAELSIFAQVCECGHEFGQGDEDDGQGDLFDASLYMLKEWFDPIGCERIQFLRTEKRRCYKENLNPDTAVKLFKEKFGFLPSNDWHQWAVMGKRSGKAMRKQYETYLESYAPHGYWVKAQMNLEFGHGDAVPDYLAVWNQKWWDVLGVLKLDSTLVIKSAYRALIKQWHPDICDDRANAELQMKLLNKAYGEFKDEQN